MAIGYISANATREVKITGHKGPVVASRRGPVVGPPVATLVAVAALVGLGRA
ncbi:MAG: hypothetical protein ABEH81_11735 [Halopenitus sp.]